MSVFSAKPKANVPNFSVGQVIKQGFVQKQGADFLKQWKTRWFVVKPKALFYFKEQQDAAPAGSVDLTGATVTAHASSGFPYGFQVFPATEGSGDREPYICAVTTLLEQEDWIKAFTEAITGSTTVAPRVSINLRISVLSARNLPKKDITGSDSYCVLSISKQQHRTKTIQKELNPTWNEEFSFFVSQASAELNVTLYDENQKVMGMGGKDDFIGQFSLTMEQLKHVQESNPSATEGVEKWFSLTGRTAKESVSGEVKLKISYFEGPAMSRSGTITSGGGGGGGGDTQTLLLQIEELESTLVSMTQERQDLAKNIDGLFLQPWKQFCSATGNLSKGMLTITVVKARNLMAADTTILMQRGKSDPFCVLKFQDQENKTEVVKETLDPEWKNAVFNFSVFRPLTDINLNMYDWDKVGANELIGEATLLLNEGATHGAVEQAVPETSLWVPLSLPPDPKRKAKTFGDVYVTWHYTPMPPSSQAEQPATAAPVVGGNPIDQALTRAKEVRNVLVEQATKSQALIHQTLAERDAQTAQLAEIVVVDHGIYCKSLGELQVGVLEAKGLLVMDKALIGAGSSDPYVQVQFQGQENKTAVIEKSLTPVWNATFSFSVIRELDEIIFNVFDHDKVGANDPMGMVRIDLLDLKLTHKVAVKKWYTLVPMNPGDKTSGEICLELTFVDGSASTPSAAQLTEDTPVVRSEVIIKTKELRDTLKQNLAVAKQLQLEAKAEKDAVLSELREMFTQPMQQYCYPLGRIRLQVIEARDLAAMDIGLGGGSSDPYAVILFQGKENKTKVVEKNLHPVWKELFFLPVFTPVDMLKVRLYDQDAKVLGMGSDDFMGEVGIFLPDLHLEDQVAQEGWYKLEGLNGKEDEKIKGEVHLSITYLMTNQEPEKPKNEALNEARLVLDTLTGTLEKQKQFVHDARNLTSTIHTLFASDFHHWITQTKAPYPRIKIEIIEAKELAAFDVLEGTSDPYVKFEWDGVEHKTAIKEKTLKPVWRETFELKLPEWKTAEIKMQMFDHDVIGSDDFMGEIVIRPALLEVEKSIDQWVPLMAPKKKGGLFSGPKVKGSIHLRLFVTWEIAPEDEIPDPDTDAEAQFARDVLKKTSQVKEIMTKIINETNEVMAEKDARIAQLDEENRTMRQKNEMASAVIAGGATDKAGEKAQLEDLIAAQAAELRTLRQLVKDKEAEIKTLQSSSSSWFGGGKKK